MNEDPLENKEQKEGPLEIPGMTRIDRPKTPIGEIPKEEQARFKMVVTGWMENPNSTNAHLGISFVYRVVPENLLAIESPDYDASGRSGHGLEGQEVMRSYYPIGAERASQVSARVILPKKKDDKSYRVEVVFKDIEGINDHRNLRMGGDYLRLIIQSPILTTTVEYGKGGSLDGFEFEGRQPVFSNDDEFDYPEPDMVDLYSIYHSVKHGGYNYDAESGERVEFRADNDPDYIRLTSTKDDKKRIIKVPIHVDFAKIREELEAGLNLEDPYNDPPEADRWLGKDLEKVVGIVEVPMGAQG